MKNAKAIAMALLAAVFYAVNVPVSKILLRQVEPTMMAALLYLGAGLGIGLLALLSGRERVRGERLSGRDLPFVVGMIVLDVAAPILLMMGVNLGSASNASLLGNFEIAATAGVALLVFREKVSGRLWAAIGLISLSSLMLSFEGTESLRFSRVPLLVLLAAVCWGFENNCTRCISSKSTYEIVVLKGIFSGLGSLVVAGIRGERVPGAGTVAAVLLLGFVAYGLSIFLYIRAQSVLGAAKTSAYYAAAPFVGALLSFLLLREALSVIYLAALAVMLAGAGLAAADTLAHRHTHEHRHTFVHAHGGAPHIHTVTHVHEHGHGLWEGRHGHRHTRAELEAGMK